MSGPTTRILLTLALVIGYGGAAASAGLVLAGQGLGCVSFLALFLLAAWATRRVTAKKGH